MTSRERATAAAALFLPVILAIAATAEVGRVIFPLLSAGGLLAACLLTGRPVLRWLRLPDVGAIEGVVLATAMGVGILGLLLLVLGFAGGLAPGSVTGLVLAVAATAAFVARPWRGGERLSAEVAGLLRGRWGPLLVVAGAVFLGAVLAVAVLPVRDWDTLMYHLPVPERFLAEGTVLGDPVMAHYGYVGAVHMLYVVALAIGQPAAAAVLSGALGLLLALFLFRCSAARADTATGALAVAALAGTTIMAFVALTPRVDVTLALFLFLAHWAVLRFARGGPGRFLILAGLLGGTALATKLHAGAYLLPLALWSLWILMRRREAWRPAVIGLGLSIAIAGPWLARNAVLFGDPIFPLLSEQDVPPWMQGDPRIESAAEAVGGANIIGLAREPVRPLTLLLHPERLSPETEAARYIWSPLLLAGLLVIVVSPRSWSWAAPAAVYGAFILGRSGRINLRYLMPVVPALSVGSALAIRGALARWPTARRWATIVLFVLGIAPLLVPLERVRRWVRSPVASGEYDTIYAAAAVASRAVPPGGAILMLYEGRSWPFDRTVIPDARASTWPLLAVSGYADACLEGLGVTHVLINAGALGFYRARAGEVPYVSDGSLDRFIQRCLIEEGRMGGHVLYTLLAPSSAATAGEG